MRVDRIGYGISTGCRSGNFNLTGRRIQGKTGIRRKQACAGARTEHRNRVAAAIYAILVIGIRKCGVEAIVKCNHLLSRTRTGTIRSKSNRVGSGSTVGKIYLSGSSVNKDKTWIGRGKRTCGSTCNAGCFVGRTQTKIRFAIAKFRIINLVE